MRLSICTVEISIFHPNDVDAWNNKGYALYNLERYDEAIGIEITNRISL